MNRFRMTIRLAMALVLFAGVAFAALRDSSVWWVGSLVACLIGLLLTACIGALYRTGRERAFWLGIIIFGGGYLLLSRVLSTDATGNPVAITNRALDTLALNLRSAPPVGAKIYAEMNGNFMLASLLQIDRAKGAYFVHYDGRTDAHNAWLSRAQISHESGDDYHAVGNLLVVILLAMTGPVVAVAFYDTRERRRDERPSQGLGGNREGRLQRARLAESAEKGDSPSTRSALSRRLIGFDGEPETRSGAIVLSAQTVVIVGHLLGILDGAAAILLHLRFNVTGLSLRLAPIEFSSLVC